MRTIKLVAAALVLTAAVGCGEQGRTAVVTDTTRDTNTTVTGTGTESPQFTKTKLVTPPKFVKEGDDWGVKFVFETDLGTDPEFNAYSVSCMLIGEDGKVWVWRSPTKRMVQLGDGGKDVRVVVTAGPFVALSQFKGDGTAPSPTEGTYEVIPAIEYARKSRLSILAPSTVSGGEFRGHSEFLGFGKTRPVQAPAPSAPGPINKAN